MNVRFSVKRTLALTALTLIVVGALGSAVALVVGYLTIGVWMGNITLAILLAVLVAAIYSVFRSQKTMKWKPIPKRFKGVLIVYYAFVVAAVMNPLQGMRPLYEIVMVLSASLYTMNVMTFFATHNDVGSAGGVQK